MGISRKLSPGNFWKIVANSTAGFVLAYLFVFYINHFAIIFTAGMFDYDLSFNYNTILFHIEPFEWVQDAVKLMYSAGPALTFIFGFIGLVAYLSLVEEEARVKIFFLWLTLIAFNYVFGGLMIGNLFKKGIGHVFNWMYFTDTQKLIVALIGFFGLISTGIFMAKPVAHSSNSYFSKLGEDTFPFFIMSQMIVPFVLGNIIIILYFLPNVNFQELYGWITLALILFLISGRISSFDPSYYDEDEKFVKLSLVLIFITIGALIMIRLVFHKLILIHW